MFNATPLPPRIIETVPTSGMPAMQTLHKSNEPNYMGVGVIAGFIVALAILGGIYYKMKLDLTTLEQKKVVTLQTPTGIPVPTREVTPTVTPIVIQSQEDLTTQQNAMDSTDFSSMSGELDKNSSDSADFNL